MTQLVPRGAMDRACVLFSDLIEGRWEKVDGEFDASLRGNVDLAREWATVADSAGSFERMDTPSARQFGGYTMVDVPLAFAAGGAIGEVVFDRADKVAGLALEFPYPRPRQLEQRRRQWEQGKRRGGFIVRNPEIDGFMRHSALARAEPAYACRQRPLPIDCARVWSCTWIITRSCSPTAARCWSAGMRARRPTSTPICATPTGSSPRRRSCST
jgi:hypothetical protein